MWEIPNIEGRLAIEDLDELLQHNGILKYEIQLLGRAKHIFSHIEWHMLGYHITIHELIEEKKPTIASEQKIELPIDEYSWVEEQKLEKDYALPTAFEYYKRWL